MKRSFGFLLFVMASASAASCGDDEDEDEATAFRPDAAAFRADVLPVLEREGCNRSGCHSAQTAVAQLVLSGAAQAVHDSLMTGGTQEQAGGPAVVDPARPEESTLLTRPLRGHPATHGGGKSWTTEDTSYQVILSWIRRGAPDD